MSPHALFPIVNTILLPAWLLLLVAPKWRFTQRSIQSGVLPGAVAALYVVLLGVASFPEGATGTSLEGVRLVMGGSASGALVCWTHFVVFDFFVGTWIVRDAVRLRIPHALLAPCVLLTLFAGPMGLLVYLVLRFGLRRKLLLEEGIPFPEASAAGVRPFGDAGGRRVAVEGQPGGDGP